MSGRTIRLALATCAFLAMIAAVTVGAASRGETNEVAAKDICRNAAWPMIPAQCLIGSTGRDVRPVGAGAEVGVPSAEFGVDVFSPYMIKQLRQDFHFNQMKVNLTQVDNYDGVFSKRGTI